MPRHQRSARTSVLRLTTKGALLRARDARAQGVHTGTLTRMVRAGELERLGPGRYCQASADVRENHSIALACGAVPSGVVCLLSALRFHNIGTHLPREVWLAIPRGTRVPRLSYPPLRLTRVSAPLFNIGIEEHRIEGQRVRVSGVSRTVVDCFRFRNKVGMDVVLEALVETRRSRRLNLNELHRIAQVLRVDRVMRPYLEMLVI
jgi:predicted transcriptional regulator of viral defense system